VPAAGSGKRLGASVPKPLVRLGRVPLIVRTLRRLKESYAFRKIIVPVQAREMSRLSRAFLKHGIRDVTLVIGGKSRAESVFRAFKHIGSFEGIVLIHDGARPLVNRALVRAVARAAERGGAALAALQATSTVKLAGRGRSVQRTLDRRKVYLAQTPQAFRSKALERAYRRFGPLAFKFTDEAGLVEACGEKVCLVQGDAANLKITTKEDLRVAEAILSAERR